MGQLTPAGAPPRIPPARRAARGREAVALLVLTVTVILVAGLPAGAATRAPSLPHLLSRQVQAIDRHRGHPPVLLPGSMPLDATHLFASGGPVRHGYDLEVGAVRGCGGANACFVAGFTAEPAHSVFGHRVTVRGASRAGFIPLSCGASCAPPQIDFLVHGIRYVIQANLRGHHDQATLIAAAQAAIAAGPR